MLTIAKLSRWSVRYYNETARAAGRAAKDVARANAGLGEYYSEKDTRAPVWVCAGDTTTVARLVGLSNAQRAGGDADAAVVARWLDDGIAPNGERGRVFGRRGVHGFDLTFCAPKSVSLLRALGDDVTQKAVANAHTIAIGEAMEYLWMHAGYSRVHNPDSGEKDLVRLPGLVAIGYQHETSRAGDPHLHTHVLLPNRQARSDGKLVSIDGTSLFHAARAAGVIYQAMMRRELHQFLGLEWAPIDAHTGMAEIAGVDAGDIKAWSQRATALRQWAANNLVIAEGDGPTAAQLAAAQKATRPRKPEHLAWAELRRMWCEDGRGFGIEEAAQRQARAERLAVRDNPLQLARRAVAGIDKPTFTKADLVEAIGPVLPLVIEGAPGTARIQIEVMAERAGVRITAPRAPHQREGCERFTASAIIAEEAALLALMPTQDRLGVIAAAAVHKATLSPDQARAITAIAASPWLIQPLSAPAGAGKTTSLKALRAAAHRDGNRRVVVLAPTGKAVDVAVREGAGDAGYTVHTALKELRNGQLRLDPKTVVVVDEAGMVGTQHLRQLLTATTTAGVKTVLVGDAHQLAPVKVRGGMFAQLVEDLPWAQRLSEVWRMRDAEERVASLALRNGGPKPVRRAVDWYRAHDRLHTGDALTMAHDALANYRADIAAGKDALLMTDNWELSDALNKRIHADTVAADAPTVTAARGHHIGEGDTVISRNNDPAVAVYDRADMKKPAGQVRNGHRWRVVAVDADNHRIAARRIGDDALAVFSGDYLREHVTHGYATTIHANQGETAGDNLTAGTAHAVLSDRATRALAYVALTRGRDENHAYLYEKTVGEADHEHSDITEGVHVARRGSDRDAAALLRGILARDQQPRTVMQTAADTDRDQLPHEVAELVAHHQHTRARLRADYRAHDDRRVAAEVLAARTAELQAATELFAAAGGRSFATCYNDPPAEMLAGFDDSTRTSVRAITASFMAVHCLSASDERQRAAVIGAVAWAAHHSGHQVWAVSTSTAGAEVAATRTHSDITAEAAEVITAMRNTTRAQVAGGLVIVEGADQLAVEHLTALTVQASLTNTKLLLVTDPTATAGPSRELTDALADALPWAQHLGPARGNDTLWARAGSWLTAQPPDPATEAAATAGRAGSQLPNWLHNQLAGAAEHRSAATLYSEPPTKVLDGLDQPGRCAVRRIAASAMTSQSLHLGAEVTAEAKAALLNAVTRAATASAATALVIPIGPGTASVAAEAPYRRHLVDPEQALHKLGHGIWKPPAGTLIVLDGADHLDTQTLTWFLRYAQHADTKLLLVTDQTSPGGSRELTDTLAASCPWAAHHLGDPDTHQAATTTVRRLITAHTELADTYREISQPPRYQDHSYSRERSRDQHLSRDDGYDLSL